MDLSDVPAPIDIDYSAEAGDGPTLDTVSHLFWVDKAGRRATLCEKQVDGPEAPRNASPGCRECMSKWNRSKIAEMAARRLGTPTLGWEPPVRRRRVESRPQVPPPVHRSTGVRCVHPRPAAARPLGSRHRPGHLSGLCPTRGDTA